MLFVSKKRGIPLSGIFILFFLALSSFLYAQGEVSDAYDSSGAVLEAEVHPQPRSMREDESLIPINPSDGALPAALQGVNSRTSLGSILRLIIVLAILCGGCYFIFRFLKNSSPISSSDPFLKSTAFLALGQGKSVAVVTLGSRAFLLGVSDHAVSLIAEITDVELIDAMNLQSGMNSNSKKSFIEVLSDFIPKSRQKGEHPFSSAKEAADFIRKRRSGLNDRERDSQ